MGYNKIIIAFFLALVPFLTKAQTEDWPRFELYQLVQGQDSGIFVITDADSNLIFAPFMRFRFDPDTALIINNDTVAYRIHFQEGLGISIEYDSATNTYQFQSLAIEDTVYNGTASTIPKGTPLYAAGVQGNYWSVAPADAADTAKMPVVAIAGENIAAGAEGVGLIKGHIKQVNTTGLNDGDEVYVKAGGGYTNTKPKGENAIVQRLGTVIKGNSANGSGIINLGDPQAVSNLNPDKIFIGGADSTVTTINLKTLISDSLFNYVQKTVLNDTLLNYTSKQLLTDSLSKYLLTVNYFRDSTRLFQDSILNHYQNATLIKSDTIRLPIGGAVTPSYWDSVGVGNIVNTNTGNVGIGQSSPAYKLDVNGTMNVQSTARFNNGNVVITGDSYLGILNSSPLFPLDVSGEARITGNTFLAFPNGKVLIDTSAGTTGEANYKLEVNGDVNLIGSGTAYRINGTPISGGTTINNNANNRIITGSGTANTLEAEANLTFDGTDVINNSGTSGSFQAKQFIANATGTLDNGLRLFNSGTGTTGGDGMKVFTKSNDLEITNYENDDIIIQTFFSDYSTAGSRKAIILKPTGVVQFEDYGSGTLSTDVDGNISASDGRLKNKTRKLDLGLDKILKLNPTYYKWKENSGFNTEFEELGFIAQEVKEIIPEAVPNDETETNRLNYSDRAIIATLVKAIQEQQIQIEQLKSEVKQLKKNRVD